MLDRKTQEEVTQKIQADTYYQDALDWYRVKYLAPIVERNWALAFLVTIVICLSALLYNINYLLTYDPEIAFPHKVSDIVDHFAHIKPLSKPDDTVQESVAKYLLADYVKTREEYIVAEKNDKVLSRLRLRKVKGSSSKDVLDEYRFFMNPLNPYGPLSRYKDQTNRYVSLKKIDFIGEDRTVGKAKIIFEAQEYEFSTQKVTPSRWEALVHFRMPDIETIAKTGAPLRFLVNLYRIKKIEQKTE